jgi:8-oxo-dGTP diphosphatase
MAKVVLRVAAKAVIINEKGRVLVVREAGTYKDGTQTGNYGIPGGRLEPGENYHKGLHREVKEETGLVVEILHPIYVGEWRPVIKSEPYQIIAIFTVCKAEATDVRLSEEHDDYKWIDPKNPGKLTIMTPDDEVIARYANWLGRERP